LHWLGKVGLDIVRCEVLENPATPWVLLLFGGHHRLRFLNGFEFAVDRRNRTVGENLISLAYEGASFRSGGPPDGNDWVVDADRAEIVTPSGIRFSLESIEPMSFAEIFIYDQGFAGFGLGGKTVLDVGSGVGPATLYYAERGARVIGWELNPGRFRMLSENVARNPELARRITTFTEPLEPRAEPAFHPGTGGSASAGTGGDRPVRLNALLERAGLSDAWLLHADLTGAGAGFVDDPDLARFQHLQILYTTGSQGPAPSTLRASLKARGFSRCRIHETRDRDSPERRPRTISAIRDDVKPTIPAGP
jgi:SAM-dependent methyltransferase